MKRYSVTILNALIGILIFGSCTEEIQKGNNIPEGLPSTVTFSYSAPETEKIETRATDNTDNSDKVTNLYIFTFNKDGIYVSGEEAIIAPSTDKTSGSITFNTTSGERYIYAIANVKTSTFPDTEDLIKKIITERPDKASFLQKITNIATNSVDTPDGYILMSGRWSAKATAPTTPEAELCTIQQGKAVTIPGKIYLYRILSQITFTIDQNPEGSRGVFTPTSYQIVNIPNASYLFETEGTSTETSYFNTELQPVRNNTFSFYMTENKKDIKSNNKPQDYNSREEYTIINGEKVFTYADNNATYVILKGSFKGTATIDPETGKPSDSQNVEAQNLTYYIHLGKGAGTGNDASDFYSYRNKKYTYKLAVKGVNNIVIEVVGDNKNNPREEGDVIYIAGNIVKCDAHFETRVLSFSKEDLVNFKYRVKTPFTNGVFITEESSTKDTDDINWVRFYRNTQSNKANAQAYPGDDNENLLNIDQLVTALKEWKNGDPKNWGNGKQYFTCFINEFYYKDKDWTKFVNTDDRTMQILCTGKEQKPENGNSSVITGADYIISQRSIQTIYKLDKGVKAWGIETINETGPLEYGKTAQGASRQNGRENMFQDMNTSPINWNAIINTRTAPSIDIDYSKSTFNAMTSSYRKAYIACMQRNRDENGNNTIESSEVKWYMPALNQYLSLWIGANAISTEATIFYKGYIRSKSTHYFSNTSGNQIIWTEEGPSFGGMGDPVTEGGNDRQYRCIRNLGATNTELANDSYATDEIYSTGSTDNKIYASNLNSVSLREAPIVYEFDKNNLLENNKLNRPYKGLEVYTSNSSEYTWNAAYDDANKSNGESYCGKKGKGWRMPNQRELTLIYLKWNKNSGSSLLARTIYGGNPDNRGRNQTHGYTYSSVISLFDRENNSRGVIRCVKDIE